MSGERLQRSLPDLGVMAVATIVERPSGNHIFSILFFVGNFGQPGGAGNAYVAVYQIVITKYVRQVVCFFMGPGRV